MTRHASSRTLATILASLALSVPAAASSLDLYGSRWSTDSAGNALGVGATLTLPVSLRWAIDLRAAYLGRTEVRIASSSSTGGRYKLGLDALPVELGLRHTFNPYGLIRPHVGAGIGYAFLELGSPPRNLGSLGPNEIDDETGFYGALGATLGSSDGIAIFIELAYRDLEARISSSDRPSSPSEMSVDLSGMVFHLGVTFNF